MAWSTTSDIRMFADQALAFLAIEPVAHSVLLTEADHLLRHPEPDADQCYGWWVDASGAVAGAFVQGPRHPLLLSLVPDEALVALPSALPGTTRIGVDERYVDRARSVWPGETSDLLRISVHRLERDVAAPAAGGTARSATHTDRELLVAWFEMFRAQHPDDPSDLAFVVDDPLHDGAIVLWEIGGEPVAMCSRTPVVAGVSRMGLVFSPSGDPHLERAALAAGCALARKAADVVLAFSPGGGSRQSIELRDLGFAPVGGRVLLSYGPPDLA